ELLLSQAGSLLSSIPQDSPEAQNLLNAMNLLTQTLAQGGDSTSTATAMAELTQAMAAAQY
ncbi:MAG: hypothetical protein ACOYIT_08540, partial [Christensenellales bacterium]